MNFFKAFKIMGMLTGWLETALVDGVIDKDEIIELIKNIMDCLDINVEFKVE